ncbi:MAG: hypothetical protein HETSPECPRED_000546 [Heterodermia speciosa]|uniref:Rhodopsin domain-containing protein n=1 Tax=Heterodermia speciosa TaxID=116794 RepID=A0A8H3G6K3_9LECA|nr:MAG: hypothetical protein HETSPECPRED_000546 [Heterodermia speciosa]
MKEHQFARPSDGDRSQGWAILAVCWAFVATALATTMLRVWVRLRLTRNLGWDDHYMMIAMVTTIIGAGLVTAEVISGGLGRHSYYLQPSQRRLFAALGWGDWIQTFITLMFTKISICLFLLRIVDSKKVRTAMHVVIAALVVFTAIFVCLFLGICRPLKAYWNTGVDAVCLSDNVIENVVIAQGVLSVITDLICAAFPVFFLRGLQVKLRVKIALCLLMGLGVITAACCTVRTALSGAVKDPDVTWAISANVGWRLPEVNIGIVCANAPVLRPLYLFYRGRLSSQKIVSNTAYSRDKILPRGVSRVREHNAISDVDNDSWQVRSEGTTDTAVSLEMGIAGLGKDKGSGGGGPSFSVIS